jgi:hypothetical protein
MKLAHYAGSTTDGRWWTAAWRPAGPFDVTPAGMPEWVVSLDGHMIGRIHVRRGAAAGEREVRSAVRNLLARRSLELAEQ